MAITLLGGSQVTAHATGTFSRITANLVVSGTEASNQLTIRYAGTMQNMTASVDANGTARAVTVRKNTANGTMSVTPTDSTAGAYSDLTHTDHFAVGDVFDIGYTTTGASFIPYTVVAQFLADVGTVGLHASLSGSTGTSTSYRSFGGLNAAWNATEAVSSMTMRAPGTYTNMWVSVKISSSASMTFTSRVNGAAGAMTVTVGAASTGTFEDTTHSDTIASGDKYNIQCVGTASSTTLWGASCAYSSALSEVTVGGAIAAFSASNQFVAILGSAAGTPQTTESLYSIPMRADGSFSHLRMSVSANTMTGTWVSAVRKNGATGNNTLSIGAATTGVFEDVTHVDNFQPSDTLNLMYSGGTSGSISADHQLLTFTPFQLSLWQRQRQYLRR